MKKLTKLITLTMATGLLLAACGDAGDPIDDDLPELEEPVDPADPDEGTEEDLIDDEDLEEDD